MSRKPGAWTCVICPNCRNDASRCYCTDRTLIKRDKCRHCKSRTHPEDKCPNVPRIDPAPQMLFALPTCSKCGRTDHHTEHCPLVGLERAVRVLEQATRVQEEAKCGSGQCIVCEDRAPTCAFQPCGHICACESCSSLLKTCPMCRTKISQKFQLGDGYSGKPQ